MEPSGLLIVALAQLEAAGARLIAKRNWRHQEASLRLYMVCVGRTPAPRGDYGGSSHEPHILTPAPILPYAGKAPLTPPMQEKPLFYPERKKPPSYPVREKPPSYPARGYSSSALRMPKADLKSVRALISTTTDCLSSLTTYIPFEYM